MATRLYQAMTRIKSGSLKGKTIAYAPTDRIEEFRRVADDFMLEIFDLLPGEYLITDESSLRDFTDSGSSETSQIWDCITRLYAIRRADVPSEILVDIFARFMRSRICNDDAKL